MVLANVTEIGGTANRVRTHRLFGRDELSYDYRRYLYWRVSIVSVAIVSTRGRHC